jgi:E3 SUMO-protein ligase RanBP2
VLVYQSKAPEDLVKKARELQLPDNFYLYLEKEKCTGCIGCEKEEDTKTSAD